MLACLMSLPVSCWLPLYKDQQARMIRTDDSNDAVSFLEPVKRCHISSSLLDAEQTLWSQRNWLISPSTDKNETPPGDSVLLPSSSCFSASLQCQTNERLAPFIPSRLDLPLITDPQTLTPATFWMSEAQEKSAQAAACSSQLFISESGGHRWNGKTHCALSPA